MRVLLVEDEQALADALHHLLHKNGYVVEVAHDGKTGLEMAGSDIYDILILDWQLPKLDGLSLLRELRATGIETPILFLTAKSLPNDRVIGLDAGADDYLVKPFFKEELLARLRSLARRKSKALTTDTITAAGWTLNPLQNEVTINNKAIKLTVKESLMLEYLMQNYGIVLSKDRLWEKVWGYNSEAEISNVDLYIHYLRKKLDTGKIKTIRGIGYCLQEEANV